MWGIIPQLSVNAAQTVAEVDLAIMKAVRYIQRSCGPEGRFVYLVDMRSGLKSSSYNIIRHVGAMYALGQICRAYSDPLSVNALVRAASFLTQKYIGPGPRAGQLIVWSNPIPNSSDAELGATGLALAALAEVNRAKPHTVPLARMRGLGSFARFLQTPDGRFYCKYRPATGPDTERQSLYYPGEAALGLIALFESDRSPEWLIAALMALSHLARSRAGAATAPADHWALIATARLLSSCPREAADFREILVAHAIQVCHALLRNQLLQSDIANLLGAFDVNGRTAPTATRLEGLLAALEFLPQKDRDLRMEIQEAVTNGISFLLGAQIRSGLYSGGVPGAYRPGASGSSEIRIDYVQHAVCAWLRYRRLLSDSHPHR